MASSRFSYPLALLFVCLIAPAASHAGLSVGNERSWQKESPDGRFVLVMISVLPKEYEIKYWPSEAKEVLRLRSTYSRSGLYRNDGSSEPLWTFHDRWWEYDDTYMTPDGTHVASTLNDPWGSFMVCMYDRGSRLAWYEDEQLIACYWSKAFVNHFLGRKLMQCTDAGFDDRPSVFFLRTSQGEVFKFDMTTGRLLNHSSPWPWIIGLTSILTPVLIMTIWYRDLIATCLGRERWTGTSVLTPKATTMTPHIQQRRKASFTLRATMGTITGFCIVLGLAVSGLWQVYVLSPLLLGSVPSWLVARSSRSLWTGLAWGMYGAFVAAVLGALADDAIGQRGSVMQPWLLFGSALVGILLGSTVGGALEKEYHRRYRVSHTASESEASG